MKNLIYTLLLLGGLSLISTGCVTTSTSQQPSYESTHGGLSPQQYHDAYHGRIDQPTDGPFGVE
ncbi:MAG: hypothetical protein EPN84_02930 [Legionella sp.]|nr:MAG: hypothetical protein EPN84_02930 [Legionella sp.]